MTPSEHAPSRAPRVPSRQAPEEGTLPLRGGCWVASGEGSAVQVARVKACYRMDGEIVLDLYMYGRDGTNLGRTSPVEGGPRSFEPCCAFEGWTRIEKPDFPLEPEWVPSPSDPARRTLGYGGIKPIPFGSYLPRRPSAAPAAARRSDYDPELEAASRRMSAQELRQVARTLPAEAGAPLVARAVELEAEADRIAPCR